MGEEHVKGKGQVKGLCCGFVVVLLCVPLPFREKVAEGREKVAEGRERAAPSPPPNTSLENAWFVGCCAWE
jgi:hypothetical protein